jgi:NTP pyrophosphatase (non-canonical NTP hydrolase)
MLIIGKLLKRSIDMKYAKFEKIDGKDQLVVVTRDELIHLVGSEEVDQYIFDNGYTDHSDETFNNYQEMTAQTAKYPPSQALEYLSLGIASEAGEVAGKMKKWIRDDSKLWEIEREEAKQKWVQAMSSEIGDVLWYCARLADELGLSLSQIAEENMEKLLDRKARGVIGGSGDNR